MVAVTVIWNAKLSAAEPIPAHPNIIYILADDLGYGDLGCYGQKQIKTPNLDRMAKDGLRFTQHYAGSTVCAPSRGSLMTGLHTGHATVRGNHIDKLLKPGEPTLGTILQSAGYRTACIGKWGVGHDSPPDDPQRCGFDYFYGYLSMWHAHNAYPDFLWRNGEKVPLPNVNRHPATHYKAGQAPLVGVAEKRVEYSADLFTTEARAFIQRTTNQPFFLYLTYTLPHANNEAMNMGEPTGMEVPDLGDYQDQPWPLAEKQKASMITRLDRDIGQLRALLKKLKLDKNTLVIFSSDNGPHEEGGVKADFLQSSGPLRGVKRDLYEGGVRVPFIAVWPGKIKAGRVSDDISAFWDILPTFAEIAGVPAPKNLDGISLLPVFLGQPQPQHEYLYWEFFEGSSKQAVRMGDWKAVRLGPSKPIELYNLKTDLGEQHNVADQHPEIISRMKEILIQVRTDADLWPLQDKMGTMAH